MELKKKLSHVVLVVGLALSLTCIGGSLTAKADTQSGTTQLGNTAHPFTVIDPDYPW